MARRVKEFIEGYRGKHGEGISVVVTRKGIEVDGWYDSIVGLPGPTVTWEELLAAKAEVDQPVPKQNGKAV